MKVFLLRRGVKPRRQCFYFDGQDADPNRVCEESLGFRLARSIVEADTEVGDATLRQVRAGWFASGSMSIPI
jgi:hypothetical protein